ncbi:FkbM family methyltransferase [Nocardiopsis sp. MG754419]|uniref:FkbM family methyltransferase n=1 Tax=Nocardiopsis sp. MG754419 TaxID=2259865 RepID=UPI001BA51690|nr:FkbM family methyltransferase [Nocardiopsis sp. MG754419]MBR8740142.1 FkbM family methyltransferase [Nocardiopsis sp. MG754419]
MPTLRRRLLDLMRRQVNVHDLGPGAAVVERRGDYRVTPAGPRAWLVSRGEADPGPVVPPQGWTRVPLGPSAEFLVRESLDEAEEFTLHKRAQSHLGARHVASVLRHYRVDCVFDVGANVGQYGRQLRRHGYRGRIVSFEPVPAMAERLRAVAAEDPDWRVHEMALGREDGTAEINVVQGSMSSLLDPSAYGNTRYKRFRRTHPQTIVLRRLEGLMDEALAGIEAPRPYLKMDTQGFDLETYSGAGKRIEEFVGLQSEVALMRIYEGMPRMTEALAVYEAEGFEVTGMYPVTREERTERVLEFDCVMVRADTLPEDALPA